MFFPIMPQPQASVYNVNLQIPPIVERLRACGSVDGVRPGWSLRANLIEILIYAHNAHSRLDEAARQCDVKFSMASPKTLALCGLFGGIHGAVDWRSA